MTGAHTPGPWEVGEDDRNGQAVVRGEHIEIATCWHHCVGSIEQEMRANALLIAASPDMLSTLDRYADTLCEGWCEKSSDCAHFDDCGGCEARRIAGAARGEKAGSRDHAPHPDCRPMRAGSLANEDSRSGDKSNFTLHRAAPSFDDIAPDAAEILEQYADFIRHSAKADDLEMHPYLPHLEEVAANLRAAFAASQPKEINP